MVDYRFFLIKKNFIKVYKTIQHSSFSGHIGVAEEDITPPVGIYSRNWGAALHDVAEGIHQPLKLVCCTFQTSKNASPLVLVSVDLGWWKSTEDEHFLRDGIIEALTLKPSQVMVCLSHTHAGPAISSENVSKPGGDFIQPYFTTLRNSAINAANKAISESVPAILTWHYGKCNLAANRDLCESHKKRYVVGFNPEGPADDTLLAGRITDKKDRIIGTIVNYACHPTTLAWDNNLISPDYVGSMRQVVEKHTNAPCLFLQGASGELAPAQQYTGDVTLAEKYGRRVGYSVLSTLESMLPPGRQLSFSNVVESGAPLAVWKENPVQAPVTLLHEMVEIDFSLKSLPSFDEIEKQWQECEDRALKERLWRKMAIRKVVGEGETVKIPLWIWRLGNSFLIGQPNEAYSVFQQELRRQLAGNAVAVMNVVNGHIGYLPPTELYDENIYCVWQTPFAKGSLELLIETAAHTAHLMMKK